MDEAEGFFPDRRLLAYRRSLLSVPAEPVPAAAAKQGNSTWWVLLLCLGPSYLSIGASMYHPHAWHGPLPPFLIFGTYLLVACALMVAVLGICVGIYQGLRAVR